MEQLTNTDKTKPHVTIYMPTSKLWQDTEKDRIVLKNLLELAQDRLVSDGMRPVVARKFLAKPRELLDHGKNAEFWKQGSAGLAIFITDDFFKYYRLEKAPNETCVVGNDFDLGDLGDINLVERYYVLLLSDNSVRLFEGSNRELAEVISTELPKDMDEALWMDDPEKSVQFVSLGPGKHKGVAGSASYFGQGANKDVRTQNKVRYFRAIDDGLLKVLEDKSLPLILATTEENYAEYKKQTRYRQLSDDYIRGNPDEMKHDLLSKKAWEIISKKPFIV
jgi:hypothetical protein